MLKEIMSNFTVLSLLIVIISFLLVYTIIPKIYGIIKIRNLSDEPNNRSSHFCSTPTMAGVAFYITIIMTLFFIKNFDVENIGLNLIAAITVVFIIGLKDDLVVTSPIAKLTMETIAIIFLLVSNSMNFTTLNGFLGIHKLPELLEYFGIIFILLTIINAFNFIDGIDGLASTIAIVIFSVFSLIFYACDLHFYFLVSLSIIAMLLAYLYYNFSTRQKIFMGDTGSLLIGFFIGFCTLKFLSMDATLLSNFTFKAENKLIIIFAILFMPLFDMCRVIGIRLVSGKSPFKADRNHIHHILIDSGLSHFKVAMTLGFLNYVIIIISLWLSSFLDSFQMSFFLMFLNVVMLLFFSLLKELTVFNVGRIFTSKFNYFLLKKNEKSEL
ncbi:UDP-N-acetylmuramyl pentapeptide phosphotransferase/UDP-N-acetylglucosamine-1-phosphate transferase [Flavobacterium sp. CG_9.1]|uniref:glycosyltransferase family 4 protein n=1 Tax=Flavobacterium sp. CG_9.1 TaxID=2787728 RepID=UPI0018C9513F|nr:MraY family glycosyltransferase [Flavobacterium sp. CG_9.1]MBG6062026.1 UDP-N-acetylmuramyl pentapeptide phosphotransferase/UDP-N-acetylglucosamine-1-phosphate transferase [Flavobacterium sp. CG_9.1]